MKSTDAPIVVKQVFDCRIQRLWSAITETKEMQQWYFDNMPDFKAEVGFTTSFDVQSTERTFPHVWEVTEVVPLEKLVVRWTFTGYPGISDVAFALAEVNGQTELTLTATVVEAFPTDIPEFKRESGEGGWKYFINENLAAYIERGQ